MTEKTKLTALDWIKGGFRSLAADGPRGLKVEVLARKLEVSKGSFYWHFKDVAALKTAMLDHWEELATQQIIAQVDAGSPDPRQRLYDLIRIATSEVSQEYGANEVSNALRNWAQFDDLASTYTSKIDQRRLGYLENLFSQIPQTRQHAKINAQIFYATLIGAEQLQAADTKVCLTQFLDVLMNGNRPTPA